MQWLQCVFLCGLGCRGILYRAWAGRQPARHMALMATAHALDRLQQQVESGSCRIAAACSRAENIIQSLCKDETSRPLLSLLPRLLTLLFGDEQHAGWAETATDAESIQALWHLLGPHGTLFTAALAHSALDSVAPFELPATRLPVRPLSHRLTSRQVPLQRQLQAVGPKGLPVPLDGCVVNVAREGPALYILRLGTAALAAC